MTRNLMLVIGLVFVGVALGLAGLILNSHAGPSGTPTFVNLSCGTSSTAGSNTSTREVTLVNNDPDGSIWVDFGAAATADADSLELKVGDSLTVPAANLTTVRCIAVTAAKD